MFLKSNLSRVSTILFILTAFTLTSCASLAYSQDMEAGQEQAQPTPTEMVNPADEADAFQPSVVDQTEVPAVIIDENIGAEEAIHVLTPEEARDIAMAHLLDQFSLDKPGDWYSSDQTPENLVGSSAYVYTSGGWVVSIQYPVVAPEYLVYSLDIANVANGLHWQGEINNAGELKQISLSEPLEVFSPRDARDAATAFLTANHGWENPGEFVEQSSEPIENAGIRLTYTSGPWVIQVEFLAGAPIVPEYRVTADHMSLVTRWVGTVAADGTVVETEYLTQ